MAERITSLRSIDGRSIDVLEADDKSWHVIESKHVHPLYAECGCIAPCPDHVTSSQVGAEDRAYWDGKYAESEDTENDE